MASQRKSTPIEWDECGWHYQADAPVAGPLTCQYILVLDALNFCFWPTLGLEYEHLARGLKKTLERDPHAFDAERLVKVTPEEVAAWIDFEGGLSPSSIAAGGVAGAVVGALSSSSSSFPSSSSTPPSLLPLLLERVRKIREVGHILLQHFQGRASHLVAQANHSAVELVRLLTAFFPSFRDQSLYCGSQVYFYKRAQIFSADVWAAYGKQTGKEHPFAFYDMEALTMFADYRVPQVSLGWFLFPFWVSFLLISYGMVG